MHRTQIPFEIYGSNFARPPPFIAEAHLGGHIFLQFAHKFAPKFILEGSTMSYVFVYVRLRGRGETVGLPPPGPLQMQNNLPSTYNISLPAQFDRVPS